MAVKLLKKIGLTLSVGALLVGCVDQGGSSESESVEESFDFTRMMANYADNIIIPIYDEFSAGAEVASTGSGSIANYCQSIGTGSEITQHNLARESWRELMSQWQQAEIFLVGPAAENGNALRNAIFSYASNFPPSSCAVDQSVVLAQASDFNIENRSFNSRGLDALEYLLFNESLEHTCPIQIVETQNWNSLSDTERKQQRCQYAQDVIEDIHNSAQTLLNSWVSSGSDYRTEFINPVTASENIEALSDALFYIEVETKDTKLGLPIGLKSDCSQIACPAAVESPYSETSLKNIQENLIGFKKALNGDQGLGFDDIIIEKGYPEVAQTFNNDIDAAIAYIDTIDSSLLSQSQALLENGNEVDCVNSAANPDSVQEISICSLHGYVKRITDTLRVEFITIVDLDLPDRSQSDND